MIFSREPVACNLVITIELQSNVDAKIADAHPIRRYVFALGELRATEEIRERDIQYALQSAWQQIEER